MNTVVTRGRGDFAVTATGMQTEMGQLANELAEAEEGPTPLQKQLDNLGKRLAAIAGALVALLFVLDLIRGHELTGTIVIEAIALAVAAIPEGLPAVVTVTLALGMHRMARQHAIVKRMAAVETLGCTTVVCSDKTGTLTLNEMTASAFYYRGQRFAVSGEGYGLQGDIHPENGEPIVRNLDPLLIPLTLCNDSQVREGEAIGDPTEAALITLAAKGGIDHAAITRRLPRIAEIPFVSSHKFMATFHRDDGVVRLFAKGPSSPQNLLQRRHNGVTADSQPGVDAARQVFHNPSQSYRSYLRSFRRLSSIHATRNRDRCQQASDKGLPDSSLPPRAARTN